MNGMNYKFGALNKSVKKKVDEGIGTCNVLWKTLPFYNPDPPLLLKYIHNNLPHREVCK